MTPERAATPPTATYRLQLQPAFPFAAAEQAVPRLAALGVSHLHLSPLLEAVPGSPHGYDVVDHGRVRAELGGEDGLRRLAATARRHGLGLIADIVPNHMAADPRHNRALRHTLREGPHSPYARWFDVDWEAGGGRLLLPVLARPLGEELDALRVEDGALHYGEQVFPLREGTAHLPLPRLLDAQWYRLGWWRLARTELNYRRFFTVSELIGLRVEDEEVFHATHATVLRLLGEEVLDGLRVDHPDGLADPGRYLQRLHEASGGRWTVVEKILADGERLPASWPVDGTTGYDALRRVDGVLTDPAGAGELLGGYRRFTGRQPDRGGDWAATVRRAAHRVLTRDLAAELSRLTRAASRLCDRDPARPDHAPWTLHTALRELLVRLPVYRPYTPGDAAALLTEETTAEARAAFAVPEEAAAVDTVRALLTGPERLGAEQAAFRARFGQTSSALRAKSVEDTAFYRYTPLLSATEVGGDPGAPAVSPADFHAFCTRIQRDWPLTGTVLSTHDTKRSADVRARIAVLTECPERWADLLAEVTGGGARHRGAAAPDAALAWVARQTALGLGEPDPDRLLGALLKHVREAKLTTTWTEPDEAYEKAVADFVRAELCGPSWAALERLAEEVREPVRARVLAAALLHLTMPGVPDLYQGTEAEYRALVDPDNRRVPGEDGAEAGAGDLSAEKTALTEAALRLRARRPDLFGAAARYTPLDAEGPAAAHCLAFVRTGQALTAVTRLPLRLVRAGGWRGTELPLPEGRWRDLLAPDRTLTGRVPLTDLLGESPVALLERTA
ncbi:malto-oligosyltrehalose synthase [Streptomyces sp. NPDC058045]|uniref:malto-oligosyltrehalose synthase n=1 Tax=Streptomyces sp. NPDC058045 TaxID=3346311 RepID=UPI0036EBE6B5